MGVTVTKELNWIPNGVYADNFCAIDMAEWDYATIQVLNWSAEVAIYSTNDGGAVTGSVDDAAITYNNPISTLATNLTNGTSTDTIGANGMYKISEFARYILFECDTPGTTLIKAMLYKFG